MSKVDSIVVGDAATHALDLIPVTYNTFDMADLQELANDKSHPYIELRIFRGMLCLVGVTRVELSPGARRDLFLLKRIDGEFCVQLTLNRKSQVGLSPIPAISSAPSLRPAAGGFQRRAGHGSLS